MDSLVRSSRSADVCSSFVLLCIYSHVCIMYGIIESYPYSVCYLGIYLYCYY